MPIGSLNTSTANNIFYTPEFKTLVRSLKEVLIKEAQSLPIVNANERYAYRYDFYKLLRSLNVPSHMYWAVAFLNGVTDPTKDNSHITSVLNISEESVLRAISRSNTREG